MDKNSSKVSISNLLKVKKAEKPSEEFWDRFDRQLKSRTIQTCIKDKPWHLILSDKLNTCFNKVLSFNFVNLNLESLNVLFKFKSFLVCLFFTLITFVIYFQNNFNEGLLHDVNSMSVNFEINSANNKTHFQGESFFEFSGNDKLSKDYEIEIIPITSVVNGSEFESDAIPVVISDTVDYSDSYINTSEISLSSSSSYSQLASFAF